MYNYILYRIYKFDKVYKFDKCLNYMNTKR